MAISRQSLKRILLVLISISIIILLIVSVRCYIRMKLNYVKHISIIQDNKQDLKYDLMFDEYFNRYRKYPSNLDSLMTLFEAYPIFKLDFDSFIDPLSCNKELITYYPIYSRKNKTIGYLLYSTGIDGKIQNYLENEDTLFADKIGQSFRFYNKLSPSCRTIEIDTTINFNIYNRLIGTKDYLISYVICD